MIERDTLLKDCSQFVLPETWELMSPDFALIELFATFAPSLSHEKAAAPYHHRNATPSIGQPGDRVVSVLERRPA